MIETPHTFIKVSYCLRPKVGARVDLLVVVILAVCEYC